MTAAPSSISLTTPLASAGVRPPIAAALANLDVKNVGQLVAYLPMRHERLEAESGIAHIVVGSNVSVRGEVTATRVVRTGKRPRFEAVLMDGSGEPGRGTSRLDLVWFNGLFLRNKINPGMRLRVQGQAKKFGPGVQIANPQFEILDPRREEPAARDARIRPVYPASEAADSKEIERAVQAVLAAALPLIEDHLPETFRKQRSLPELREAYRMMHAPASEEEIKAAQRRLAYDELLMLQLGVHLKRAHLRQTLKAPALRWTEAIDRHIRERFAFTLTPDQDEVVKELVADLTSGVPTNRLIQGDVGSGKTVVALYAMLLAAASRHQAALMAPTELLAEQHAASIGAMLEGSKVRVELLTGGMPEAERSRVLAGLESGAVDLVIGTHALLTESVKFNSLAVAVIDEQHRFGVHQRARLRSKGTVGDVGDVTPHVIVMTATPIPRTLALTLFGDLDVSTIRHLPPGRKVVRTRVVGYAKAAEVYRYVRERVDKGDQAYIVVPAIDTGGGLGAAQPTVDRASGPAGGFPEAQVVKGGPHSGPEARSTVEGAPKGAEEGGLNDVRSLTSRLEAEELKGVSVASMHGRLSRQAREQIMGQFRNGRIKVLVATTVIEVGVDVPNATIIVVEHADRFGLAQLHQLRGRVGRGAKASACILLGDPVTPDGEARLHVMAKTADGFELAEKDMELRGPGEVIGTRQAGMPAFKVADLMRDRDLLNLARRDAAKWIEGSPVLDKPEETLLRRRLLKAYGPWLGLADVG
jgi:ATP-dependent DNA helicase RecG